MQGKMTGLRSFQAKNLGLDMSILANLGLLALMAWPMSWKARDRGW